MSLLQDRHLVTIECRNGTQRSALAGPQPACVPVELPLDCASACDQVNHRNHHGYYQQKVNKTAGHMEAPAQQPENEQNCKNRPKHRSHLGATGSWPFHGKQLAARELHTR